MSDGERIRAADDVEAIQAKLKELAYNRARQGRPCKMRTEHTSAGCWCANAGPGGSTLSCPVEKDG